MHPLAIYATAQPHSVMVTWLEIVVKPCFIDPLNLVAYCLVYDFLPL